MRYGKMILALAALLCAAVLTLCGMAQAEEVTIVASGICGAGETSAYPATDAVTWELDSNGTLTLSGEGAVHEYQLVNYVPWNKYRADIKQVVIEEGVTEIPGYSFDNCTNLTSAVIADSVTSFSFPGCSSLQSARIPAGMTTISLKAFNGCSSLTSMEIPQGVTAIGNNAFSGCSGLTSIVIPEGVTSIGTSAFYNCTGLTSVTIPESVTSIGNNAFQNCTGLTEIDLPDGLTELGDYAFQKCSGLTSMVLPDGVTSIGVYTFEACTSLISVTIPDGVTSIGRNAFAGSGLTGISIPDSVTTLGMEAFKDCASLKSIVIPGSVREIPLRAFFRCDSLSSITMCEGVETIGDYAFAYCENLTSISIPDSVASIGTDAFYVSEKPAARSFVFHGEDLPEGNKPLGIGSPYNKIHTIYCYEFSEVDMWATEGGYQIVYIDGKDEAAVWNVILPDDCTLAVGRSMAVTVSTVPAQTDAAISWSSSAPEIVSVENGVLTALSVGEATITASCGEASDTMVVTTFLEVDSFELNAAEIWVVSKKTAQLEILNILPEGATVTFAYASSDTKVATVNKQGKITAKNIGEAVITVTADNGLTRTCTVHVCYPVTGIELDSAEHALETGDSVQLNATVTTRDATYTNKLVTFTSSDESIVKVDESGMVTAVGAGTAEITVKSENGITASCVIVVTEKVIVLDGGDANQDGTIDLLDALVILQYDAGWAVDIDLEASDVNSDDAVDLEDGLLILQYCAGAAALN